MNGVKGRVSLFFFSSNFSHHQWKSIVDKRNCKKTNNKNPEDPVSHAGTDSQQWCHDSLMDLLPFQTPDFYHEMWKHQSKWQPPGHA